MEHRAQLREDILQVGVVVLIIIIQDTENLEQVVGDVEELLEVVLMVLQQEQLTLVVEVEVVMVLVNLVALV
jgi:hypothetical protein